MFLWGSIFSRERNGKLLFGKLLLKHIASQKAMRKAGFASLVLSYFLLFLAYNGATNIKEGEF